MPRMGKQIQIEKIVVLKNNYQFTKRSTLIFKKSTSNFEITGQLSNLPFLKEIKSRKVTGVCGIMVEATPMTESCFF